MNDLTQEEREKCINTIIKRRNNGQNFRQNRGFSYNGGNQEDKYQLKLKKDKKKKDNNYMTIKCGAATNQDTLN